LAIALIVPMKLQFPARLVLSLTVLSVLFFSMIGFQVRQADLVVLTRFGQPVRVIDQPGLYFKWPWPIERVNRFDGRLQFFESRISEALTRDKRNVIIPLFVAWRISDPLKFLESIGSEENAQSKLDSLISSAKNTILGNYDFGQLVSMNPGEVKLVEIEARIVGTTALQAKHSFGIDIAQIGIRRLTLPEVNTHYVFERMSAERQQFAERYRAEGRQQADQIRAETDAEASLILAEAQKKADEIRGKGEAEAARIYAVADAQDPDFYKFLRKLEVLRKAVDSNTTLVIDANSPPFDMLKISPDTPGTSSTQILPSTH
jgi:modulator of FtsH protease HflC